MMLLVAKEMPARFAVTVLRVTYAMPLARRRRMFLRSRDSVVLIRLRDGTFFLGSKER